MDDKLRLLASVPLFSGLGARDLERLGQLTDEIDVPAGRVLMREGGSGEEFFVIVEGAVTVERGGEVLTQLGPGDILGEIALVDGGPRSATATAAEPCRLLVVGHQQFHSLMREFPDVQTAVLQALARRVRHLAPDAT